MEEHCIPIALIIPTEELKHLMTVVRLKGWIECHKRNKSLMLCISLMRVILFGLMKNYHVHMMSTSYNNSLNEAKCVVSQDVGTGMMSPKQQIQSINRDEVRACREIFQRIHDTSFYSVQ